MMLLGVSSRVLAKRKKKGGEGRHIPVYNTIAGRAMDLLHGASAT